MKIENPLGEQIASVFFDGMDQCFGHLLDLIDFTEAFLQRQYANISTKTDQLSYDYAVKSFTTVYELLELSLRSPENWKQLFGDERSSAEDELTAVINFCLETFPTKRVAKPQFWRKVGFHTFIRIADSAMFNILSKIQNEDKDPHFYYSTLNLCHIWSTQLYDIAERLTNVRITPKLISFIDETYPNSYRQKLQANLH